MLRVCDCFGKRVRVKAIKAALVLVEKRGRICVWTMNLTDKLNCLNSALLGRLRELFADAADDDTIDAVV